MQMQMLMMNQLNPYQPQLNPNLYPLPAQMPLPDHKSKADSEEIEKLRQEMKQ